MKPVSHQYEDKLLEFAYGELPAHEASAIDAHVKTCARCTAALGEIRSVRSAMSVLPQVPVPDTGLESLLAYAEQTAKRNAEAAKPAPFFGRFRKWVAPLAGATAVLLVGGVYWKAQQNLDLSPERAAVESAQKKAEATKGTVPVAPEKIAQAEEGRAAPTEKAEAAAAPLAEKPKEAQLQDSFQGRYGDEAKKEAKPPVPKPVANTKAPKVQRDDKELQLDNEPMVAGGMKAKTAPSTTTLDLGTKGGGGRELDGTRNYVEPRGSVADSPAANKTADLDSAIAKADVAERKQSASKVAPREKDTAGAANGEGFAYAPTKTGKKKKPSKLEVDNSSGGGEIARAPTGSYSNDLAKQNAPAPAPVVAAADKKTEEKPPAKEAPPQTQVAANNNVWTPEAAQQAQAQQQAPQFGVSTGGNGSATQQAAPQPPPPPTQQRIASAPKSKSGSIEWGSRSVSQKSSGDEELEAQPQTPSMKSGDTADLMARRQARQSQLADLMRQARAAENANDIKQELNLSLQVLQNDAEGELRAEGLYRMCTGYQRLGLEDKAQGFCDELVSGFPSSVWTAKLRSAEKNGAAAKPAPAKKSYDRYEQEQRAPSPRPASEPANSMHAY